MTVILSFLPVLVLAHFYLCRLFPVLETGISLSATIMKSLVIAVITSLVLMMRHTSLLDSVWFGVITGLANMLMLPVFTAVCEHLKHADVPAPFKGAPITLLTTAVLSLALRGLIDLA